MNEITIEKGALQRIGTLLNLQRRVLIVTDTGVPEAYVQAVADSSLQPHIVRLAPGEQNKCPERWLELLGTMCDLGFDRGDCVVAVGGGVVGDLAGFAAASYMRGIDFYNVPTTLLSQVDASVGGKTAIDFHGYKNIIGAFYQPKAVVIDAQTLQTSDARQLGCGMAEAIKMLALFDGEAFKALEARQMPTEALISKVVELKMQIVNQDEKEKGLRRLLNFGHTVGHGVEHLSAGEFDPLLHGECVSIGMLCMAEEPAKSRLMHLLHRYDLPTAYRCDRHALAQALTHDKKSDAGQIHTVRLQDIGRYSMQKETVEEILNSAEGVIRFR